MMVSPLTPSQEMMARAAARLLVVTEALTLHRRQEERLVGVIRNARLLRGALADEDDKWQQVAELRAAQASAREAAAALRAEIRELQGPEGASAHRSVLGAKRAEEAELVAAISDARVAGSRVAGEDEMWARVGVLRGEQVALSARIRALCREGACEGAV